MEQLALRNQLSKSRYRMHNLAVAIRPVDIVVEARQGCRHARCEASDDVAGSRSTLEPELIHVPGFRWDRPAKPKPECLRLIAREGRMIHGSKETSGKQGRCCTHRL